MPLERIHRENLASWSAWAFFDTDYQELTAEETKDNELIVDFIAQAAKWDFPPGAFSVFVVCSEVNKYTYSWETVTFLPSG